MGFAGQRASLKLGVAAFAVAWLLSACGASAQQPGTGAATASPGTLQAEVAASEIVVGAARVPIGILDHNTPINDATVRVRSFVLQTNNTAVFRGEAAAPFKGDGLQGAGVYVAQLTFDRPGSWGIEVTATRPDGASGTFRLPLNVLATPTVPGVGQAAPLTRNPTVKDVPDVRTIDSGNPPDDMHQLSVAEAIGQHRPTLVVFASPAFCTSRICGPEVKVVQSMEAAYRSRLAFIHIEVYRDFKPDPSKRQLAQAVLDWRLQTEPWIFLIDSKGIIRQRFEGPTAADELKVGIDQFLAAA